MKVSIFWFRRDLRIHDNMALTKCVSKSTEILPLYIIEDEFLTEPIFSQPRTQFLLSALNRLRHEMEEFHSKLFIFKGKPHEVIHKICSQLTVEALYFNRNYEPKEIARDRDIWDYCQSKGIQVKSFKDQVLHERGEILKKDKKPYSVFSFYYKKWRSLKKDDCEETRPFKTAAFSGLKQQNISDLKKEYELKPNIDLDGFLKNGITNYDIKRDYPYLEGTSRISAYLRTGVLSIRKVYHSASVLLENADVKQSQAIETFIKQLSWRDFYYQILYHFPYVENGSFKKKFNDLKWSNDKELFHRWCEGTTGIPIVDAGMRQLNTEGWMHNRLRMITASFLTKDLLIDWRWGEAYFKERLIDYDLPLNNGGWQWCASTGTDAQPYFRIFNPFTQSQKYDPEGQFIRNYIPELRNLTEQYIHQPWNLSEKEQKKSKCILGKDYPFPIVDHSQQRKKALDMYKQI